MFDRFAFGMEVLNAWFSHSLEEKLHSFPLPFDCWQTNQISFACARAFSSFLTILTMMSKVRQWCLMLPGLSSSPMKTNSYVNWICQIQGSAKDRDTLWEFPLKGLPYVHLNRRRPPPEKLLTLKYCQFQKCSAYISVIMVKHSDRNQLGWGDSLFQPTGCSPSLKKVRAETQAETYRNHGRIILSQPYIAYDHLLMK